MMNSSSENQTPNIDNGIKSSSSSSVSNKDNIDSDELAKKRSSYYSKWDKVTKEELSKTKEEDRKAKEEADKRLGLDPSKPKSKAEERDRKKHEALKEAKKQWQDREEVEKNSKFFLAYEQDVNRTLKAAHVEHKPVLVLQNCVNSKYIFHEDLGSIIKIFVENCENCTFEFECQVITQHIEFSHCNDLVIDVNRPLATLQIDLCENVNVNFKQNVWREGDRVYHAGVKGLVIHSFDQEKIEHTYPMEDDEDGTPSEEIQYISHLVDGNVKTERVIRNRGEMPMTDAELRRYADADELELKRSRQAELKKEAGNEAFSDAEYLQASVFYTQAMELSPNGHELLHICLCNRAACWLKLGHPEKALDDANASLELKSDYVKAWFRKGLAHHAQKEYGEACRALVRAHNLAPKNKQIKQALGFAEMKAQKQMNGKDDD